MFIVRIKKQVICMNLIVSRNKVMPSHCIVLCVVYPPFLELLGIGVNYKIQLAKFIV